MADYAKSVLGFDGMVLLEDRSATNWENISNVIPLLEDVDRIKITSQPAHARKARAYLRRQRPDLAERLVRADDYRPGEWMRGKPLLALYGLWTLRGLKAEERKVSLWTAAAPSASHPVILEPSLADDCASEGEECCVDVVADPPVAAQAAEPGESDECAFRNTALGVPAGGVLGAATGDQGAPWSQAGRRYLSWS